MGSAFCDSNVEDYQSQQTQQNYARTPCYFSQTTRKFPHSCDTTDKPKAEMVNKSHLY